MADATSLRPATTADEINLRAREAERWLDAAAKAVWKGMVPALTAKTFGRQVHAQRARTLRRRGEVVHFSHRTPARRCVYCWLPRPFTLSAAVARG